jgi:hypothetical protein
MSKDYKVGFGRPPRHTQFKPGQSGNPAGRPKGTKNLRTDLGEELAEKITVTEGGRQLVISKQRAMLKSLLAKAMKGETAAARSRHTGSNCWKKSRTREVRNEGTEATAGATAQQLLLFSPEGVQGGGPWRQVHSGLVSRGHCVRTRTGSQR